MNKANPTYQYSIQIYSECDGWSAAVVDLGSNSTVKQLSWNHNDDEFGAGGEKLLAGLFEFLGYHVYLEEVY